VVVVFFGCIYCVGPLFVGAGLRAPCRNSPVDLVFHLERLVTFNVPFPFYDAGSAWGVCIVDGGLPFPVGGGSSFAGCP